MKKYSLAIVGCILLMLVSCSKPRDVDRAVIHAYKKCIKSNNYTIDFSSLLPFEWDTMCYYSSAYDLDYIVEDLHINRQAFTYYDVGERVFFFNQGHIVYQKGWFPYPEPQKNTIYFDTPLKKFKVDKSNAKFVVAKTELGYRLSFIEE